MSTTSRSREKPFILVAALPRTGTSSLKSALGILGFGPAFHMSVIAHNKPLMKTWTTALRQPSTSNWPSILQNYNSALDEPTTSVTANIIHSFIQAKIPIKVVLVTRNAEKWWSSINNTILKYWMPGSWSCRVMHFLSVAIPGGRLFTWISFHSTIDWHRYHLGSMNEYAHRIKTVVKDVQQQQKLEQDIISSTIEGPTGSVELLELLEYEVSDGWEPLCKFLDVATPVQEFPTINDTDTFGKSYWKDARDGVMWWTIWISSGVLVWKYSMAREMLKSIGNAS